MSKSLARFREARRQAPPFARAHRNLKIAEQGEKLPSACKNNRTLGVLDLSSGGTIFVYLFLPAARRSPLLQRAPLVRRMATEKKMAQNLIATCRLVRCEQVACSHSASVFLFYLLFIFRPTRRGSNSFVRSLSRRRQRRRRRRSARRLDALARTPLRSLVAS